MRGLLVGGGLVDVLTLHPLWSAGAVLGALLALRRAGRALAAARRPRAPRPSRPGEGESEASSLV